MNVEEFMLELDSLVTQKELAKVEPFLQTTLEYAKKEEDYSLYLAVENELLGFYRSTSQYEKAFLIADDLLMLLEELNLGESEYFANTLLNVATLYHASGRKEESYQYYLRVLALYEHLFSADDSRFATLYTSMSFLLQDMEQWDLAERLLHAARSILEKKESC